ncbi:MAG TPA: hypothetical protein VFC30_04350 [Solirubrobacteraceae bacterium]|nr:hypothetical protein [Solirubrobacteraceae bacterium]
MSATTTLGPLTDQALALELGGAKRKKLLVTIAAALDAGIEPTAEELLDACPELLAEEGRSPFYTFDHILRRLEQDGWVKINRRRYHYTLNLDQRPESSG